MASRDVLCDQTHHYDTVQWVHLRYMAVVRSEQFEDYEQVPFAPNLSSLPIDVPFVPHECDVNLPVCNEEKKRNLSERIKN